MLKKRRLEDELAAAEARLAVLRVELGEAVAEATDVVTGSGKTDLKGNPE